MRFRDAKKLHNEDEVAIKNTKEIRTVIEIKVLKKYESANGIPAVSILLDDGNWYGHKEVI